MAELEAFEREEMAREEAHGAAELCLGEAIDRMALQAVWAGFGASGGVKCRFKEGDGVDGAVGAQPKRPCGRKGGSEPEEWS